MPSIQSRLVEFWFRHNKSLNVRGSSYQQFRLRAEQAAGRFPAHKKVQVIAEQAGAVPAEWLIPPQAPQDRVILYLHGGAWFMCSPRTHRGLVSYITYESGIRALSIEYRLAPENPFPAGLDDCLQAYEWLLQRGFSNKHIVVAGDSAGGNLTLSLLVALRDAGKPLPACAVALSPATDLAFTGETLKTRAHIDPILANFGANDIITEYIARHDPREPLLSPLYADLHGLPPLLIHVGDHEILLDDSLRFVDRARAAGVLAEVEVWPEMFHVFQIFVPLLPEARRSVAQIGDYIHNQLSIG